MAPRTGLFVFFEKEIVAVRKEGGVSSTRCRESGHLAFARLESLFGFLVDGGEDFLL